MSVHVITTTAGRRVPAILLAPGIHATRAKDARPFGPGSGGDGPWRLLTTSGVPLADWDGAFDVPLDALRVTAAALAMLPVPWADGDREELGAALVGAVREQALDILRQAIAGAEQ